MSNKKDTKIIERVDFAIKNIKEKKNKWFFFVVDSKNVPNSGMEYMYQMAYTLKEKGFDVTMLYQLDNEYTPEEIEDLKKKNMPLDNNRVFTGVGEWLGTEYAELPHMNIQKEQWVVSPSDFLFVPEVFSSLLKQTYQHNIPCKRFVVLQNYDYISEFIPFGDQWASYGVGDVITTTEQQKELILKVFPYLKCKVLNPYIKECFRSPIKSPNLIVNIVSKKQSDVNRIIKPFYWRNPWLQFVTFKDLRGYSQNDFADSLKEGAITVWVDDETPFGYSALEAIRCNNIVLGKIPQNIPEWMGSKEKLFDNGIWFSNINDVPDMLANIIESWMNDEIPEELTTAMKETNKRYTREDWEKNIDGIFNSIMEERIAELENVKETIKNKKNNEEEAE